MRSRALPLAIGAAMSVFVVGCATTTAVDSGGTPAGAPAAATGATGAPSNAKPSNVEPPPPNVNLSGFPLTYRQGYADGCTSAGGTERKDTTRFAADGNYRTGWQDGLAICRKK